MAYLLSDCFNIMRRQIGRNNVNDPDSTNDALLFYINLVYATMMNDDVRLFENYGTLIFNIDATTPANPGAVYTFNDIPGVTQQFVSISKEAFISILDPPLNSVSWNRLPIYQDPGEFYMIWGVNNLDILIHGYPTMVLFYNNEFVFRTLPNVPYQVQIFGYTQNNALPNDPNSAISYDYWLRYISVYAAYLYAMDYRYEAEDLARIKQNYNREKKNVLTHTHNQIKMARCMPSF